MKHALMLPLLLLAGCASTPPPTPPSDFTGCPQDGSRLSVYGYDWLNGRPNYIDLSCEWYQHVYRIAVDWPTNVPPPAY